MIASTYRNCFIFFFQAEDGIRDVAVTGVQTCALPISRGGVGDAGQYKEKDSDIIEKSPDGRQRVRFRTVPASETATQMHELFSLWKEIGRASCRERV